MYGRDRYKSMAPQNGFAMDQVPTGCTCCASAESAARGKRAHSYLVRYLRINRVTGPIFH